VCGIAGVAGPHSARVEYLERAVARLRHRGPDAHGVWQSKKLPVAFGHTRLAIVDLSAGGTQPKTFDDELHAITYNGELYNFRSIQSDLAASGELFASESDTEVLLRACARWGVPNSLPRFRGMFAFAYLDVTQRRLWLVRDRFGEKPLYWTIASGSLAFASELPALTQLLGSTPDVDRSSLERYFRRMSVPAPDTMFEGIHQVRPGHFLEVRLDGDRVGSNDVTEKCWWNATDAAGDARRERFVGTIDDAADRLDELLRASVERQLVGDVPIGSFLSGGIDSSIVTAVMGRLVPRVSTFTIGFEDASFNEAQHAREIARHLDTDHAELTVTAADALRLIPELDSIYGEPFADSSQIPTILLEGNGCIERRRR
jgi:asparagine synthase (glutamine-hydrolysing)